MKWKSIFQTFSAFHFGDMPFAKNISAEKNAKLFNLPQQFANSQFVEKNVVFDIFILSAVKLQFAKLQFADSF